MIHVDRGESTDEDCGMILMEKSKAETNSGYGHSQAIKWEDISQSQRIQFENDASSWVTNNNNYTPRDFLKAMGTDYYAIPEKKNCIGAAKRVMNLYQPDTMSRRSASGQTSDEEDFDEDSCEPTSFTNSKPLKSSGSQKEAAAVLQFTVLIISFIYC